MTATIHEFRHFFDMRCDMAAHPDMRTVACPLLRASNNHEYYKGLFSDKIYTPEKENE